MTVNLEKSLANLQTTNHLNWGHTPMSRTYLQIHKTRYYNAEQCRSILSLCHHWTTTKPTTTKILITQSNIHADLWSLNYINYRQSSINPSIHKLWSSSCWTNWLTQLHCIIDSNREICWQQWQHISQISLKHIIATFLQQSPPLVLMETYDVKNWRNSMTNN